jgi:hypothetical protein
MANDKRPVEWGQPAQQHLQWKPTGILVDDNRLHDDPAEKYPHHE